MSFFDKTPHVITQEQYHRWKKGPNSKRFRCYLCGHWFEVGDTFRAVPVNGSFFDCDGKEWGMINFLICSSCDTGDNEQLIETWKELHEEFYSVRFWALRSEE